MSNLDFDKINKNIKEWSNEELISNATIKLDHWVPEVQSLISTEIKNRNISQELIKKLRDEELERVELNRKQDYQSIKGWLLFFLIQIFFGIISSIRELVNGLINFKFDFESILFIIIETPIILLFLSTAIQIIKRKQVAIKLSKIILYLAIIVGIISLICSLMTEGFTYLIFAYGLSMVVALLWLNYFKTSKRVLNTLIN